MNAIELANRIVQEHDNRRYFWQLVYVYMIEHNVDKETAKQKVKPAFKGRFKDDF